LDSEMLRVLQENRTGLSHLRKLLIDPKKKIEEHFIKVDDLINRFRILTLWILNRNREKAFHLAGRLYLQSPIQRVKSLRFMLSENGRRLGQSIRHSIELKKEKMNGLLGKLDSLSPLSILQRGYSITRKLPSLQILRDAAGVRKGDKVEVKLHRGTLLCGVEKAEMS